MKKRTFLLLLGLLLIVFNFALLGFDHGVTDAWAQTCCPCSAGFVACTDAGGDLDACWAGWCACMEE